MTWLPEGGLRVGSDLVIVADVVESVHTLGDRYLRRIFTSAEIEHCSDKEHRGSSGPQFTHHGFQGLAARFAAKEAVIKVLRPGDVRPNWRSIEVVRRQEGWTDIALTGTAAELADRCGLVDLAVSLSHEGDMALAVAVGHCHPSSVRSLEGGRGESDGVEESRGEE